MQGLDPNPNNIVAAGSFFCRQLGAVACLVRVETNAQAQAIRLSIKTTNATVTLALKQIFLSHLAAKDNNNNTQAPRAQ